jgi:TPR repeat protein
MRPSALAFLLSLQIFPAFAGNAGATAYARGDYETAYNEWLKSADNGDPTAMEAVGMLYDTGQGVRQSFFLAMLWYNRAANAGNVAAMFDLGAMYDNGRGIPLDRLSAIKWYKLAAQRGNGRAAYNLGVIYRDGDGIPRNITASIDYFKIAASHGIKAANQNLEQLDKSKPKTALAIAPPPGNAIQGNTIPGNLNSGNAIPGNVPPDNTMIVKSNGNSLKRFQDVALERGEIDAAAAKAFSDAIPAVIKDAEKGNELAEYYLGYAYQFGIGVPKDPMKSYILYIKSSSSNDAKVITAAIHGGIDVGLNLTKEQLASAGDLLFGKNLALRHKGE